MSCLLKGAALEKGGSWRPRMMYRMAAGRWNCHIDSQVQVIGGMKCFVDFQWTADSEFWRAAS